MINKRVHTFAKGLNPNMKSIARLSLELAYRDYSHYVIGLIMPKLDALGTALKDKKKKICRNKDQLKNRDLSAPSHFFFFHHTTCESTCDTLTSSAANQGDNPVSVAQGDTATPGATKQLLPPVRVFKRNIYLNIHKIN